MMPALTKELLRRDVRTWAVALNAHDRARWSGPVVVRFLEHPAVQAAAHVMLFASLPSEPDTAPIFDALHAAGKRISMPLVHPGTGALTVHEVRDADELVAGTFGILEPDPARCPVVQPDTINVVAVPGLAFDRRGHRLGRGRGFYDRFLPSTNATTLGLFFATQERDPIPVEPHDVPLDAILTERELIIPA
jgi:5-formyltetrahydrofolate cyclo-ligase